MRDDSASGSPSRLGPADASAAPCERSVYGAPRGVRSRAFLVTLFLHAAGIVTLALRWSDAHPPPRPSALLTVTLLPLASPPAPETDTKKPAPAPERKREKLSAPPTITAIIPVITPPEAPAVAPPRPDPPVTDTAPRRTEAVAPKAAPAPPAPQPRSNAPDTWEGRVLARLETFRRYPGAARGARQQGVVYIRFRINRAGHVLSSALARSSGFPMLDQAALDTLRRADPLPEIPADRPDEIEVSVPVEYYLR